MAKSKSAASAATAAVRVLPRRRLILERAYTPHEELALPVDEAADLVARGFVQYAHEEAPKKQTGKAPARHVERNQKPVTLGNIQTL